MGNLKLTKGAKMVGIVLLAAIVGIGVYWYAPGLRTAKSVQTEAMDLDDEVIDNVNYADMLPLPTDQLSTAVQKNPQINFGGYAWNGQTGIYTANGGKNTTKGSLMEKFGINLNLVRQDMLSQLQANQMKFIEMYDNGNEFPNSDDAFAAIMIMGDGAPWYISTMNKALVDKFGEGKYHVEVVGAIGMSNGEDKLIGPAVWKSNPKSMIGSVISLVIGDGDWVTAVNYCSLMSLPINPDPTTYDPNAVNFYPSEGDDYMNSAKELIKSQTVGWTVPLKEVVNGELTGKTVQRKIDGCATWTPGDKKVFDALNGFTDIVSTRDFPNQMPTSIIIVKEWAATHPEYVENILSATYTANNQIKQYDQWARRGSEAIASGFGLETPDYWYNMFKGQTGSDKNGLQYSVGGTRVLTYADAMQYYGITDGINRYEAVYNQVGGYVTALNVWDFNTMVGKVTPYSEAVNLSYLRNTTVESTGKLEEVDYSGTKTTTLASGEWYINFNVGSNNILPSSNDELESLYNLLVQAEQTKLSVVGHTDDTGSDAVNVPLSKSRAQAVIDYLVRRGINRERIQEVRGAGSNEPLVNGTTSYARSQNRRVQVTLLQ